MPATTLGDQRWSHSGYNEDGERVFTRVAGGVTYADEGGYEDFTKDEIQQLLKNRDLPVSGSKAELIERLQAYDSGS